MAERGGPVSSMRPRTSGLMQRSFSAPSGQKMSESLADEECAHALLDLAMSIVPPAEPVLNSGRGWRERGMQFLVDGSSDETSTNARSTKLTYSVSTIRDKESEESLYHKAAHRRSHSSKISLDISDRAEGTSEDQVNLANQQHTEMKIHNTQGFDASYSNNYPRSPFVKSDINPNSENQNEQSWTPFNPWMSPISPQVSLLRMQLDAPPHVQTTSSPKPVSEEDEGRIALIKRVQLDHSYAWTDYKEFSNLTVIQGHDPYIPDHSPYIRDDPIMTFDDKGQSGSHTNVFKEETNMEQESIPSHDKHHKFHLLLKCLTVANDDKTEDRLSVVGPSVSCEGSPGSDDDEDSGFDSFAVEDTSVEGKCYNCKLCSRTSSEMGSFNKEQIYPGSPNGLVACSTCQKVLPKKEMQHKTLLNKAKVTDVMATCQFCGVCMKHNLLIKHLAQEHCVENNMEEHMINCGGEGNNSYHTCNICKGVLPVSTTTSHFLDHHNLTLEEQDTCSLCGTNLSKDSCSLSNHLVNMHCSTNESISKESADYHMLKHFSQHIFETFAQDDTSQNGSRELLCNIQQVESEGGNTEQNMECTETQEGLNPAEISNFKQ